MTLSDLERRVAELEAALERQSQRVETLDTGGTNDGISRRTVLQALGVIGLGSYATESASADPQGQLGTNADPVRSIYTQRLAGGVTGDAPITSLRGAGLTIDDESLRALVTGAKNLGNGDGLFSTLEDGTLRFRTLAAGSNVSIDKREGELVFDVRDSTTNNDGANLGSGTGLYAGRSGTTLQFRSLVGGTNVTLSADSDEVTIDAASSAGETNTASNVGTGAGWFKQKVDTDLEFKSLVAGTNLSISDGSDSVTIDAAATYPGVADSGSTTVADVHEIDFNSNLSVTDDTDGTVTVDASDTGEANTASNVGTGASWFKQKSGSDLEFRTVTTQGALTATENTDTVSIAGAWSDGDGDGLLELDSSYTGIDVTDVAGTQVVTPWVGTSDATALEAFVNGTRVARFALEGTDADNEAAAGNVLLGQYATAASGVVGAVISGGGGTPSGDENAVGADFAAVSGGKANTASTRGATVGGGEQNTAKGSDQPTVAGGYQNTAEGWRAFVGGGLRNTANGSEATVAGGVDNTVNGSWSAIGGGEHNEITAEYATIAGGGPTDPSNASSTNNAVYDYYATIGGGGGNQAGTNDGTDNAGYATVGGGFSNTASAADATIAGGSDNTASGYRSFIGGGNNNAATNEYGTIPGGKENTASGLYSFAGGRLATAGDDGTFVWGDGTSNTVSSAAVDQTVFQANGGMYVGDDGGPAGDFYANGRLINTSSGAYLSTSGTWTDSSSRTVKENLEPVDGPSVLEKVQSLSVSEWSYTDEQDGVRHMGPMAEDFYETFGLGADDKHIASLDTAGVALAAINGLAEKLEERDERIDTLEDRCETHDERLVTLEDRCEAKDERIAALEADLESKDERIDRLENRLADLERAVNGCD